MAHIEDRWKRAERSGTGRRWRVRYLDPAGRERSRSFDRKRDADKFRVGVEADVQRGTFADPDAGKITLRRYATSWLAAQTFDESTRDNVERKLRLHAYPVLGDKTLGQLAASPSAIQAWRRGTGLAATTARALFSNVSAVLTAAVDDGLIQRNPCKVRSVKPPRLDERKLIPWTADQVTGVRTGLPPRYQALVDAGRGLVLRQGQAFGLAAGDIDFLCRVVHVRRQVKRLGNRLVFAPPKGGKDRDVPLPASIGLRLSAHMAACPAVSVSLPWKALGAEPASARLLFTTVAGAAINSSPFDQKHWHGALRLAGVPVSRENGFHALRHHYASG